MMTKDTVVQWIGENIKTEGDLESLDLIKRTFAPNTLQEFFQSATKLENTPEAYELLAELIILGQEIREKTMEKRQMMVKRVCGYFSDGSPCYLVTHEDVWCKKE